MSKLYIAEYVGLAAIMNNGNVVAQVPLEPPIAEQVLDYSGGVATSAAFNTRTRIVRIETDAICSILFGKPDPVTGTGPTAAVTNQRFAAGQTEYKAVNASSTKVSAITNT